MIFLRNRSAALLYIFRSLSSSISFSFSFRCRSAPLSGKLAHIHFYGLVEAGPRFSWRPSWLRLGSAMFVFANAGEGVRAGWRACSKLKAVVVAMAAAAAKLETCGELWPAWMGEARGHSQPTERCFGHDQHGLAANEHWLLSRCVAWA